MAHIDDIEIIRKCQQGDQEAFKQLVQKYQEKNYMDRLSNGK